MRIKAVLLDLDDTLWPVAPVISHAEHCLQQWIAEHVPEVAREHDVASMRARRQILQASDPRFQYDLWALRHTLLTQIFAEYGVHADQADRAMAVFAHARNQVNLYDDVEPALTQLAQRVRLGTVSNGFADLAVIGLADFFSVSIAAHRFGAAKPAPQIFHAACAALDMAPAEVLYVGDDLLLDVQGAQQAGLQAAWMNRHDSAAKNDVRFAHIRPQLELKNLHELLSCV